MPIQFILFYSIQQPWDFIVGSQVTGQRSCSVKCDLMHLSQSHCCPNFYLHFKSYKMAIQISLMLLYKLYKKNLLNNQSWVFFVCF